MNDLELFINEFFPNYFKFKSSIIDDGKVILKFETKKREIKCPCCGAITSEFVTYYIRTIQDLPILDRNTYIEIRVKKMSCNNKECGTKYFNEPLFEYVQNKKRYSNRLLDLLVKIALTESGEGGSRICKEYKIIVSGDKLLQLALEYKFQIDKSTITQIGVDDFALKKNIDMVLFL